MENTNSNNNTYLKNGVAIALASLGMIGYAVGITGCKQMKERSPQTSSEMSLENATQKMLTTKSFEMKEVPFAFGNRFNVYDDGKLIGIVDEEVFNWGVKFDFYSGNKEKHLGYAEERVFNLGLVAEVYDNTGKKVGRLDQSVLNWTTTINLQDGSNRTIATSQDKAFAMPWKAKVYSPNKKTTYGKAEKSFIWDNYYVEMSVVPEDLSNLTLFAWIAMEDKMHESSGSSSSSKNDDVKSAYDNIRKQFQEDYKNRFKDLFEKKFGDKFNL